MPPVPPAPRPSEPPPAAAAAAEPTRRDSPRTPPRRQAPAVPKSSPSRTRELETAIDSEDMARRLDGLPPLKRNRQDYVELKASPIPAFEASEIPVPMDDSSFELFLLAEFDDELDLAKTKSSEIAWARLT